MPSTVAVFYKGGLGRYAGVVMKSRLVFVNAVTGAALLLAGPVGSGRAETSAAPGPQVSVVKATNACFSAAIRVTGFLVARAEAVVGLDAPGAKVTEVLVNEGDRVTAGQTLARYTRVVTEGPEAGRTTTVTLRAPSAGVVMRSTAAVGATPSPMMPEPLFRIAVENDIELEAEVPSVHVPALASGQTARIEVADGRELAGRVRLAPATIDQRTQLGRARLSLERDASLRPGMFARATIDAKRSCGLSVPRSAVRYRTEGTSVQVVRNDMVETRRVQVGLHSDTDTEIRDGLRDGDLVVANAGGSLQDGDKVKAVVAEGGRSGQR
jgi:multidrug efflux pump subunit AcrA (membrane-fusion protein)